MSIALTLLEKAVEPSTETMQSFEGRMPKDSIIRAFNEGTNQVVSEESYKAAKASLRRPVDIAVIKTENFFVNTVREINPTPDVVGTDKVPINFSTLTFSFIVSPPLNSDNYFSVEQEIRQGIFNGIMSTMFRDPTKALELTLAAYLESHKWAAPPVSTVDGVTVGTGQYEMPAEQFILKAPVVMEELEIFGRFADIHNIGAVARQREIATYGRANTQNLDQYQSEMDYYRSNKVAVAPGNVETHFLYPQGSLGLINWVEDDARKGRKSYDGFYTIVVDPFFGFEWAVFIKEDRADMSGTGGTGLERATVTRYDFATSLAPVSPYSSQPGISPIVKFGLTAA